MLVFGGIPFDCVTTFFTFALVSSFAYGDGGTVELLLKVVGILIALLCVGVGKSFSITLVHPAQKLSNAKPCALDHPGLKKPTFCKSKRSPFWVFRHCETFFRNKKIDFFSKIVFFDVSGKSDFEFLWVSFRLVFGTVNLMKNFTIVYLSILKTLCPFVLPYFACKYRSWQTACFFLHFIKNGMTIPRETFYFDCSFNSEAFELLKRIPENLIQLTQLLISYCG